MRFYEKKIRNAGLVRFTRALHTSDSQSTIQLIPKQWPYRHDQTQLTNNQS